MSEITFEFACRDDCLDRMVPSDLRGVVAERDRLRSENEALRAVLKAEAEYCYGYRDKYAQTDPERAKRHGDRGDRLMAAALGEQRETEE